MFLEGLVFCFVLLLWCFGFALHLRGADLRPVHREGSGVLWFLVFVFLSAYLLASECAFYIHVISYNFHPETHNSSTYSYVHDVYIKTTNIPPEDGGYTECTEPYLSYRLLMHTALESQNYFHAPMATINC